MGPVRRISLTALTGLTAFAAWYGTWLLVAGDEASVPLDPPTWLPGGWLSGGLALALAVAVPMSAACWLLLIGHPRGRTVAFFAGVALMAWIVVQVLLIGYQLLLQPLMFILGAVIAALGWPLWGGRRLAESEA
jgi:hypothetical protein